LTHAALLSVALLLMPATAVAGPFEDAVAAYEREDYATALKLFRPLAEQGGTVAQLVLGRMYYEGRGVPQNYAEAFKWLRRAAEQGNARAKYHLGWMCMNGFGVSQDLAEAVKWFRGGADQGDAWAQNQLGRLYYEGQGVPQDYVSAHMWFNLAAAAGHTPGAESRDDIARQMTAAQIAEAQKLAREWKPKKE
jgi:uncharacterized protein